MVLHQEPGGGAVFAIHRKEAGGAGQLVMGPIQPVEHARSHQGTALEADEAGPRWGAGVPHLLPSKGHSAGRKDVADVDVHRPDGP